MRTASSSSLKRTNTTTGPSAGQAADAQAALRRDLETDSRQNGYLLNQLASAYQYGEPIPDPGPDTLPEVLAALMRDVGAPSGIAELGYTEDDVPALVEGTMKQQRLLVGSPREVNETDIAHILNASMTNW